MFLTRALICFLAIAPTSFQECPMTFRENSTLSKLWDDAAHFWHCAVTGEADLITPNERNVLFKLYTRRNRNQSELLRLSPREHVEALGRKLEEHTRKTKCRPFAFNFMIPSENFNCDAETKILVHGYSENLTNTKMIDIKNGYLARGEYNVILVDWSVPASSMCYVHVAKSSRQVGELMGRFLDQLILSGASIGSIHIIGFSLGAHIAGFAGKAVRLGVVKRITGLDPALPMFVTRDASSRLHRNDAEYVDIIHTCAGILGIGSCIGHADFFPNGGSHQSGCCNVMCSHSRAPIYFYESIVRPAGFKAVQCSSWKDFLRGSCHATSYAIMGDASEPRNRGSFYLLTANCTPYHTSLRGIE